MVNNFQNSCNRNVVYAAEIVKQIDDQANHVEYALSKSCNFKNPKISENKVIKAKNYLVKWGKK